MQIQAPKATEKAFEKLLDKMYISNVSKRLRELNQPSDIDRKRWIWELIQNAKDTIANDPNRDTIKVKIIIDGDNVKFLHNGNPFTADARLGLLYKYSEDKENAESTGRFGTGFLTTHCLSKIVTIESNMYGDDNKIVGFSVTMFRDGFTEQELLDGLDKMRASEAYYSDPYEWTTYIYHVNTDSGRLAIKLGIDNFKENIAQTLLFCKELASIELIDNGKVTTIERISDNALNQDVCKAKFKINVGDESYFRTFIYRCSETADEELSLKYKKERTIRLNVACEVDENKNIISTSQKTSLFCVFPLVGIESQIQMPLFVDSPDFEPDSERQSLILSGLIRDEEKNIITEVGINQKVLEKVPGLYRVIVDYLSSNSYNCFYNLANGLKSTKDHEKLDKKWYDDNIVTQLKMVLSEYPIVKPFAGNEGASLKKLSECIFVKEKSKESQDALYSLLSSLYPMRLASNNTDWAVVLWKDDTIQLWNTEEACVDIESKDSLSAIIVCNSQGDYGTAETKIEWYNKFLKFVSEQNELLLKEHALLPNMNGKFLKKDTKDFKQGEGVDNVVLDMLYSLGGDMRPLLLHESITSVSLESKFNSTSYSAKANSLAKSIIELPSNQVPDTEKLNKLKPLFSIIVSDASRYEADFIKKHSRVFSVIKELFELNDLNPTTDDTLTKSAWDVTETWLINLFINTIESKNTLSSLPTCLDAKWLNNAIYDLGITLSKMNEVAILPNQNGKFCKSQDLFIDGGVPEILKDDVFIKVGISYKDILLDNNINAKALGKNNTKTITNFAEELSAQMILSSTNPYPCYGFYCKYNEDDLRKVSEYLIQILPSEEKEGILSYQSALKDMARFFLYSNCSGVDGFVNFTDWKLWNTIDVLICWDVAELIEKCQTLTNLKQLLNATENVLFENLNILYGYLSSHNGDIIKKVSAKSIYLNQNNNFVKYEGLFKEGEVIDTKIKEIISLISERDNNYYDILLDNRCAVSISQKKTLSDAYSYIDSKIKALYDVSTNWERENFKNAVQMLIEEWGETNKNIFDENHFPKVFPIKDSISMNVVWTKAERHQLQNLKSNLNAEQLADLVAHIDDFKDLSARNKELENENENLRQMLKALTEGKNVDVSEAINGDASKKQQFSAQLEAQNKLMGSRPDWTFPDKYGECNEEGVPYNFSVVTINDETGEPLPIVLKSYKSRQGKFKINPEEWSWVVENDAKLLVYTTIDDNLDIVEVPQNDLVMNQSDISITFSSENLDKEKYSERVSEFAETLHYFTNLHFDFNSFHVEGNAKRVRDIYAKRDGMQTNTTDNDL